MAETHVVSALVAKRSELAGFITDLEKRAAQHRADLGHVDAMLRLYGEAKPEAIRPKGVMQRNDWFSPGECARPVYDILRPAEQPVTTLEVVESIMAYNGLDAADVRMREMIQKTILATMNRLDAVERIEIGGNAAGEGVALCSPGSRMTGSSRLI